MQKIMFFLPVCGFFFGFFSFGNFPFGIVRVEADENITTRMESERFHFRILREEEKSRLSFVGSAESPEVLDFGGSLEFGPIRVGSLRRRGFLSEVVSPFSASISSSLYREAPGYEGDFSLEPGHRYGLSFSPGRGTGIALFSEEEARELWGWWSFDRAGGKLVQTFFSLSFSSFVGDTDLQFEYAFRPHSSPLLYTGFRLSLEEPGAGLDLLLVSQGSRTGKPGFYTRFRLFGKLSTGCCGVFESLLMGRLTAGSYSDPGGDFIEREAELHFRSDWSGRWWGAAFQGELGRDRKTPVPRRFVPVERMLRGTLRFGGDTCSLEGEIERSWSYDEAGLSQGDYHANLSAAAVSGPFRGIIGLRRDVDSDGTTEDLVEGEIQADFSPLTVELKADSGGRRRVRLDFSHLIKTRNSIDRVKGGSNTGLTGGTAAGEADCSGYILLETEETTSGREIELSLGWTCEIRD